MPGMLVILFVLIDIVVPIVLLLLQILAEYSQDMNMQFLLLEALFEQM
jgi:hypothetical protein